jgi:hypothetical protein
MENNIFRNGAPPKGLVFCNLKSTKTELPAPDSLPALDQKEFVVLSGYSAW